MKPLVNFHLRPGQLFLCSIAILAVFAPAFAQTADRSFTTGLTLGTLRNNYTGFTGMKFTVGATALKVTTLGRIIVSGNSQTHTVKLVRADGTDLPGGAVTVNTVGRIPDDDS